MVETVKRPTRAMPYIFETQHSISESETSTNVLAANIEGTTKA